MGGTNGLRTRYRVSMVLSLGRLERGGGAPFRCCFIDVEFIAAAGFCVFTRLLRCGGCVVFKVVVGGGRVKAGTNVI